MNYDDIKNFIRQHVIKIFDGEARIPVSPSVSQSFRPFPSHMKISLLGLTELVSSFQWLFVTPLPPVRRENGLLHVTHTDASGDGGLTRSPWAPGERRHAGAPRHAGRTGYAGTNG